MSGQSGQGGSFFGGLLGMPLNALVGAGSGVLGSIFPGALMWGAGILGMLVFMPDLVRGFAVGIGGQSLSDRIAHMFHEGWGKVLTFAGLGGLAISGITGGLGGAFSAVMRGFTGEQGRQQSSGNAIGGIIGTGALAMVVGAVAIGALHNSGITHNGSADPAQPLTPPPTPGRGSQPASATAQHA